MQRFNGIIFDFNGVLWWDTALQEQSWQAYARQLRGAPFTKDEMDRHMHGRPNKEVLEYLTGRHLDVDEVGLMTEEKETIYRAMCLELGADFRLSPGAVELLGFLTRNAIPHTIATASEKHNVGFFVKHLRLDDWFAVEQIVYDDGTFPGKPEPDIYQRAAKSIGLPPAECIVIEDSLSGLSAARRAGIGHIVALCTSSPRDLLLSLPGVNQVLDSLDDFDTAVFA
jgi:HAD superfamily hydrolase (TIGR01549 family)